MACLLVFMWLFSVAMCFNHIGIKVNGKLGLSIHTTLTTYIKKAKQPNKHQLDPRKSYDGFSQTWFSTWEGCSCYFFVPLTVEKKILFTYWLSERARRENIWLEVSQSARPHSVNKSILCDHFFFHFHILVERGQAHGSIASFRTQFQRANDFKQFIW